MRVRIGSELSDWLNVLLGVPHGSILGPILFNIFLNELFFLDLETEICNFADDNTLYACDVSIEAVIAKLNRDIPTVINWFRTNQMVVNANKSQVMFLGCRENNRSLNVDGYTINISNSVKLFGVTLDNRLSFNPYILGICTREDRRINALLRIGRFLMLTRLLSFAIHMICIVSYTTT